jgi:hypothetical protein
MPQPFKITEAFAFVMADDDGTEGVPGYLSKGTWMPMVGTDLARVESLMPVAQEIANVARKPIRVVKFTGMQQIGEISPTS